MHNVGLQSLISGVGIQETAGEHNAALTFSIHNGNEHGPNQAE